MSEPSMAGRLLVATPLIDEPTFERTVILLLGHSTDGALGLVLNRPSDTRAEEVLPEWADRLAEPAVLFIGGPVASNGVIGLGADGAVDLNEEPGFSSGRDGPLRLFAGSAGWGPGQLEGEIGERAWWVVEPAPGEILTSDPSGLWRRIVHRQRQPVAWFADYPPSLLVN